MFSFGGALGSATRRRYHQKREAGNRGRGPRDTLTPARRTRSAPANCQRGNGERHALSSSTALAVGLPGAVLPEHPDEGEIVAEALADHRDRLRDELRTAAPEHVVTLGNAALRVLRHVVEVEVARSRLHVEGYGARLSCRFEGRAIEWLPLAHPAAPEVYQQAHVRWRGRGR